MNIVRYKPITKSIFDWDFDSLLDRFYSNGQVEFSTGFPKVDVKDGKDNYTIEAELPGYTEKDVDVKVDGDLLTISSAKKEEKEEKKNEYIIRERHERSFTRSFTLPKDIDRENIKAHYKNGVLSLELPKKPETKPRSIEVKAN
ncbi:MAG: Hsp20/alpha crystallin family protein [Spirochaetales bacterium]|nr:Hsp20/alpha crystallin family protein [Spirochaetales bacterium]